MVVARGRKARAKVVIGARGGRGEGAARIGGNIPPSGSKIRPPLKIRIFSVPRSNGRTTKPRPMHGITPTSPIGSRKCPFHHFSSPHSFKIPHLWNRPLPPWAKVARKGVEHLPYTNLRLPCKIPLGEVFDGARARGGGRPRASACPLPFPSSQVFAGRSVAEMAAGVRGITQMLNQSLEKVPLPSVGMGMLIL